MYSQSSATRYFIITLFSFPVIYLRIFLCACALMCLFTRVLVSKGRDDLFPVYSCTHSLLCTHILVHIEYPCTLSLVFYTMYSPSGKRTSCAGLHLSLNLINIPIYHTMVFIYKYIISHAGLLYQYYLHIFSVRRFILLHDF